MSRHAWTPAILPASKVRVTSYNLLADLYADSEYSRTVLFAQCPAYALAMDYRVKLIMSELIGYNSDIITLQECDRKVFDLHLNPVLGLFGFSGKFGKKGGQVDEGLATFYRKAKFKLISSVSISLPDALNTDPKYSYILDKVADQDQLLASLTNRTTTVSICVLQAEGGELLVVGNTHLYFSPNADHIRLIQVEMCRVELEKVRREVEEEYPGNKVTVMLCGDFNSTPPFGVLEYLTGGLIGENHPDWRSQEGEEVSGLALKMEKKFISSCGTPKYTNYTHGFKDCLDYIFIEEEVFEVDQVIPFPSEEELSQHIALPNIAFPSDHVALVVDLNWK
jgi:2',5'-phosphodiesterase